MLRSNKHIAFNGQAGPGTDLCANGVGYALS